MKKLLIAISCVVVLWAVLPVAVFSQLSDTERAEGFVSLFNGNDLTGWEGNPAIWKVENGTLVGQTAAEGPAFLEYNQFLVYKGGEYGDFVMRFDMKCSNPGNTGMQYRSWMNPDAAKPYSVFGYQADFDGVHFHTGILYGEGFRGILCERGLETVLEPGQKKPKEVRRFAETEALKKELKIEDWNSYEITAKGFTFTNTINGHVMSICTDEQDVRRNSGIIAIQVHKGQPMKVEVKNIRIKKLK